MRWRACQPWGLTVVVFSSACSLALPIDDGYQLRPADPGAGGGGASVTGSTGGGAAGGGGAASVGGGGGAGPSVTVSFGERSGADVSGVTADTHIDVQAPTLNYGAFGGAWVDAGTEQRVTLLRFDLSSIPATATVDMGALSIFTSQAMLANSTGVTQLFEVLEPWEEGNGDGMVGAANWYDRMAGVPWTSPGAGPGSLAAQVLGAISPTMIDTEYLVVLPSTVVQGWVSDPVGNHGVAMVTGDQDGAGYALREYGAGSKRPLLTVTYSP